MLPNAVDTNNRYIFTPTPKNGVAGGLAAWVGSDLAAELRMMDGRTWETLARRRGKNELIIPMFYLRLITER